MNDEKNAATSETTPRDVARLRDRDWLLADLVRFTNSGFSFDVILTVNGQIIAGRTISGEIYFEEMAKRVEDGRATASEDDKEFIDDFAAYYRKFKSLSQIPEDAPDDYSPPQPTFIHLQNARFIGETTDIPHKGGFTWRGRLAEISGFSLGTINRS